MYWQEELETLDREQLAGIQLKGLQKTVANCYENVPYYREKLSRLGIHPSDIKTLDDVRKLPFTKKSELRDNYPYGLFARPIKEMVRIHGSSGTTGKPTIVGYTRHDLDIWSDCVARVVSAAGATSGDVVQIAFGYGLFTGALGLHQGLEKINYPI